MRHKGTKTLWRLMCFVNVLYMLINNLLIQSDQNSLITNSISPKLFQLADVAFLSHYGF